MTDIFVVLACSMKHQGRCIAGKSATTGLWVRLVSNAEGAEVPVAQTVFTNSYGTQNKAKPLQKLQMTIGQHVPLAHQPENFISVPGWVQVPGYNLRLSELRGLVDSPLDLWGIGDRVDSDAIGDTVFVTQSLYLVQVLNLHLHRNWTQRRVTFVYNGAEYDLSCTDLQYDDVEAGRIIPNGYLCISLGEEFRGDHYKIVATIFGDRQR